MVLEERGMMAEGAKTAVEDYMLGWTLGQQKGGGGVIEREEG